MGSTRRKEDMGTLDREPEPIDQSTAMIRHSGATDMPQDQSKLVFPSAA
jgi:hypothetical protein